MDADGRMPMEEEERSLFKGLPPLPKGLQTPPTHGLVVVGEGQEAHGTNSQRGSAQAFSLQDRIAWVQKEMLSLQQTDLALLRQLGTIAQEIQDLRELQLEMEEFFAEGEPLGPDASSRQPGGGSGAGGIMTAAFQLTL